MNVYIHILKMTTENNTYTTIRVKKSTKKDLETLKIHPNQSYNEVIVDLLKGKIKITNLE